MRGLPIIAIPLMAIAALVVISPYRSEEMTAHVVANPTGCQIAVNSYGGWEKGFGPFGLPVERVSHPIEAYIFIEGCPGAPEGRPEAIVLRDNAAEHAGENCGSAVRSAAVCRVRIPVVPRRYQILVKRNAGAVPQVVDIGVRLNWSWRSGTFDAIMSV